MDTTRVCKECLEVKELTEFYMSGRSHMSRCKQCMSLDGKVNRYIYNAVRDGCDCTVRDWPKEISEAVEYFARAYLKGGRINYGNSCMPTLVQQYISEYPDKFGTQLIDAAKKYSKGLFGPIDMLYANDRFAQALREEHLDNPQLTRIIDAIVRVLREIDNKVSTLQVLQDNPNAMPSGTQLFENNPSFNPSTNEIQERANLIKRVRKDLEDNTELDMVDIKDIMDALDKLFREMQTEKDVNPYALRTIVYTYELNNLAMSTDMLVLYRKFILPGLQDMKRRPNYQSCVQVVSELGDKINYFEEPWENIPHME